MATRQYSTTDSDALPETFRVAVAQLRAARLRPEVLCEEMPAPQRIAPYAAALSADVTVQGQDVGTGRLVLLHDPAGNDTWEGTFRCVAYARAEVGPDQAGDPLLAAVSWTWFLEALHDRGAEFTCESGTVTTVVSESFGSMQGQDSSAQVELRASWTPAGSLEQHVQAWGDLLCQAVGLEPVPEGVASLPNRRGQRGE